MILDSVVILPFARTQVAPPPSLPLPVPLSLPLLLPFTVYRYRYQYGYRYHCDPESIRSIPSAASHQAPPRPEEEVRWKRKRGLHFRFPSKRTQLLDAVATTTARRLVRISSGLEGLWETGQPNLNIAIDGWDPDLLLEYLKTTGIGNSLRRTFENGRRS